MPIRMLKKDKDKKEDKKKKPKGSSKLDIFKSYGKYDGKPVELKNGGISKIDKLRAGKGQFTMEGRLQTLKEKLKKKFGKKTGGLTGGQVKLDKNKDGKISGEDFKMMKRKRGGATRKNPNSPKGQNPISEYDRKGKLKYTAANKGAMMNKSTRGYGAARTSGMGLQDEKVKSGEVKPVKAFLGLGVMAMKKAKKKGAKGAEFLSPALLAKRILGKKTGGPIGNLGGQQGKRAKPKVPGNMVSKERLAKLKQQLNRFKNTSTKGGGADSSKIMSDKTKTGIKRLAERIARLTPTGRAGSDAGKILREKLKKKIMTPAKKMGGGMMMKQYNKGGSVTASCKLGRNKATKLY